MEDQIGDVLQVQQKEDNIRWIPYRCIEFEKPVQCKEARMYPVEYIGLELRDIGSGLGIVSLSL